MIHIFSNIILLLLNLKIILFLFLIYIFCNFKLFFCLLFICFLKNDYYSLIFKQISLFEDFLKWNKTKIGAFLKINNEQIKNIYFYKLKINFSFFHFFVLSFFIILSYYIFFLKNIFNFFWQPSFIRLNFLETCIDIGASLDYINFYFILLTNFIFILIYYTLNTTKNKKDFLNFKLFLFLLIILDFLLILTFVVSNIFFFFFFFESSLIPVFILLQMGGKGVKKKQYAGFSLIFFTLTGSIFLLFAIIYQFLLTNTFDFKQLNFELLDFNSQLVLFLSFFIGFSVKIPIFPFYSWLPEAHVEASTIISILLAAIFLKVATYGLLKIVVYNFSLIVSYCYSFVFFFSLISIFIASFLTLLQTDLKKIVALTSIIHMNFMVIAFFSLDAKAILGSFIYMFSHAFISSGLFYLIGLLYEYSGTRDLLNFDKFNSKFFLFFFIFNLANISFPLTISFISEIIILNNLLLFNSFIIFFFIFFIFFSVIYTFWMLHNVFFGKIFLKKNVFNLNKYDLYFLFLLFLIIFFFGLLPSFFMFNLEQEIYLLLLNKINMF